MSPSYPTPPKLGVPKLPIHITSKQCQIVQNFALTGVGDHDMGFQLTRLSIRQLSHNSLQRGAHSSYKCIQYNSRWIRIMFAGRRICRAHRRPQSHNLWAFLVCLMLVDSAEWTSPQSFVSTDLLFGLLKYFTFFLLIAAVISFPYRVRLQLISQIAVVGWLNILIGEWLECLVFSFYYLHTYKFVTLALTEPLFWAPNVWDCVGYIWPSLSGVIVCLVKTKYTSMFPFFVRDEWSQCIFESNCIWCFCCQSLKIR